MRKEVERILMFDMGSAQNCFPKASGLYGFKKMVRGESPRIIFDMI